ncbi:hypothetical protein FOA52_015081 [Chlamydomonas sp. UWO 241]|nr:hypothetical protein FOA52_015081 [Chlamydomonas sp. UWO 241]
MPSSGGTLLYDRSAVAKLESQLAATKAAANEEVFFPHHAHGRGGIGHLVSTGSARAGIIRLQQRAAAAKALGATATLAPTKRGDDPRAVTLSLASTPRGGGSGGAASVDEPLPFWRTSSRPSTATSCATGVSSAVLGDAAAMSAVVGGGAGVPALAKRLWEAPVPHPHDFISSARGARTGDVLPGSRWVALSYYETDVVEVKRHLEAHQYVEAVREEGLMRQRHAAHTRTVVRADQQRELFRRQRAELAARYAAAGLPERTRAYSALPATRALAGATARCGDDVSGSDGGGGGGSVCAASQLVMPKPRRYKDPYYKIDQQFKILKPFEAVEAKERAARAEAEAKDTSDHLRAMDRFVEPQEHPRGGVSRRGSVANESGLIPRRAHGGRGLVSPLA